MGNSYFPDDNELYNLFHLSAFNDASLVQFLHRKRFSLYNSFFIFDYFIENL